MALTKATRIYPVTIYRWVADILPESDTFTPGSLANFAVEQNLLRKEHAKCFRIAVTWWMTRAQIHPQTTIISNGMPIEAWWGKSWKQVINRKVPAKPKVKYHFLIERAVDGELHHASSLSWLMKPSDLLEHNLNAPNEATARYMARRALARIRRKRIRVPPIGTQGVLSEKRRFTVRYPAWSSEVWKSAVSVPGYYGLHEPHLQSLPAGAKSNT